LSLIGLSIGLAAVTLFLPTLLILAAALPLITGALGLGGGSSEESSSGGGKKDSDPLLEEIRGLRADIQGQPIQIVINDKVVTEMNKKNTRMQGYRDQMK
jgi:hypothetical protein